ncbi:universal stress protein [Natronolimnohabitans innermongolicus]|uniref:UspA domain-containing protein n=1 Tax=Natronolimnohabitans innermongolicus JCM 12255 TaxID=1227499 RepID=L9XAQ3_9EURY|nr:universal stress protein [Natronolimnohabitans innermongolicus]ELY58717.1 UspA domain-containing protein [Natronolimnohabitans innermongolicus JCM 12255]
MSNADRVADPPRSILVPTDGSDAATAALERALAHASRTNATVHVLSVLDTTTDPLRFDVADVAELHQAKTDLVDEIVETAGTRDVDVRGAIRRGRPADVALTYADENDIDTIVVGQTGRSRLSKALLGSTTDRLLRQASIPVLVVPADESDTPESRN